MNFMSEENKNVFEFYLDKFREVYITPDTFIEFTVILIIIFLLRWRILFSIEKNKMKKYNDAILANINMYIFRHCMIELLIAFFVCYCAIKVTDANPESYVINLIAAPAIGILIGILFDDKIFIPLENATGIGTLFNKITEKKYEHMKEDKDKKPESNIVINVGNNNDSDSSNKIEPDIIKPKVSEDINLLTEDVLEADNFDEVIVESINQMKQDIASNTSAIATNADKLDKAIKQLISIRDAEMINKKIELKKMIYECLNNGYATPVENDKITMYYNSYTDLGGNHEVQTLYEQHYLKLSVHEDRRKNRNSNEDGKYLDNNGAYKDDRRHNRPIYKYGQFDSEVLPTNNDEKDKSPLE
jgi:hypothetical protein